MFYDVTTFLYYLLVYTDASADRPTPQVVGFFSKEKLSWDNNNLACILVLGEAWRSGEATQRAGKEGVCAILERDDRAVFA